ncbi:nodulation protein NodH [Pseudaestuariivita atlantica]|uniref:Nodulation protein NodH n=1 Tax=Pseudaestuariivita atlantica TaxID=1317121 RepID=A0A0L1JNQ2_9RHOB|nr:nodulation protein NodH [Pseudaestuariivita atlantica]KNG93347.1 nodulation protein NodH [Pseudaestuariivita atlantica]
MGRFTSFVVFAEMRTGSNFLETNINAIPGLQCHGEAFNPHFIGYPDREEILGIRQADREADPHALLTAIRERSDGLGGFRYFNDHDPRVLEPVLADTACAKVVLTRNPLDSYVSWKIAQETGQWKLTHHRGRKTAKARFEPDEFSAHVARLQAFQVLLMNRLQTSGQTAFYIDYEDLQRVDVMNGLAAYLGVDGRMEALDPTLKRQNPGALRDKIENMEEAEAAMAELDRFHLSRTPNFEPRRGPAVPSYVAAAEAPLLYLPIRGGPVEEVSAWLAALDGLEASELPASMNQKALRQWKRKRPGHRSFTVLRHPLARAHHVFTSRILATGEGSMPQIRATLRRVHDLPIPSEAPGPDWTKEAHYTAFSAFLDWVKLSLAGSGGTRMVAAWESQSTALQGFGDFVLPDAVLREEELAQTLPALALAAGCKRTANIPAAPADTPFALADIYDAALEEKAQDAYARDYMMFGFGPWRG